MGRLGRIVLLVTLATSSVAHAQAGATKEEKEQEKIERMGAKTPAVQIKPDSLQHKPPVITFQSIPAQPYTGPILDFKPGPGGQLAPYDVRTGQYVNQDVRNTASWRRKDGIIYDIGSGAIVPKAVVDASEAAYKAKKAGAPDPTPETHKLSFNTDSNLPEAERKAREKELNKPKNHVEVWKAGVTGKTGIDIDALGLENGEVALVPENAYVDLKLKVGQAEGTAVTQANVGPDGVDVNVNLEAKVVLLGVQAETGKLEAGDKMLGGSIYARGEVAALIAEAKAQGHLKVGKDGVLVGAEGGAFAGGKAKLEVPATVNVGGVETRATVVGEVSYGIGIEGKVYTKITWTSLKFRAQGHAALGLGAGGEIDVEISVAELVKEIAPPEAPNLAAITASKNELTPIADHWTLSKDDYKKLAAAVLAEEVNRGKALSEIGAREKHWLGGLGDYTETKRSLREGTDFGAPFARLSYEIYRNNPDALAGYNAAIEEAKASGLANDGRWGGNAKKRLDDVVARNARVKMPFDSSRDFVVPETSYWYELDGKRHKLPSHTGPKGLTYEQQLGLADFWVSISDDKKKEINKALQGRSPEEQLDVLKTLASEEISRRIDSERDLQARPDTGWILNYAPPEVRAAAEKRYSNKQLNIMERTVGRDGRLLEQEILEMLDRNAPAATIASQLWVRGAPSNTEFGRRARQETQLQGYPDGFNMYLRWLSGERKSEKDRRLDGTRTDQEYANILGHFTAALNAREAQADKVLAGLQAGRYQNTTVSGAGEAGNRNTRAADGAGKRGALGRQ